ncbi:MAG: type IV secretory system conjugative DNA transfer family protein [Flammeovirgaceae bacterium]
MGDIGEFLVMVMQVTVFVFRITFKLAGFIFKGLFQLIQFIFKLIRGAIGKTKSVKGVGFSFPSTNGATLKIANPQRGILVSGGQGSGKTRSLIEPIIWQCARKGYSGILYDYESPTLTKYVHTAYQNQQEIKNYYVNFSDLTRTHRLNPLDHTFMTESAFAKDFADTILSNLASEFIKNPNFFTRSSKSMLAAVFWYLREEKPKYCTLPHAIHMILSKDTHKLLSKLAENMEVEGMIASIQTGLNSPNQNAGVVGTLQNIISDLNTPKIAWVLSGNELTLDLNNPTDKKFLTVANTPQITTTLSPVISLIFSSALAQMNQQGKAKSACIIDELPRVFIPNLDAIPATARKNLVAVILALQDYAQLEDKYGEKKAEVIISVLANQLYGKTTNVNTAERVSKLFGKYDKAMTSKSTPEQNIFDKNYRTSTVTTSSQQRPVIEPQEVINLATGQFLFNIVEADRNVGKFNFKQHSYKVTDLPAFSNADQQTVKQNFERIRSEALAIVNGDL